MSSKKHVFSSLEKKCFTDILKRYLRIVENKETDSASLRAKTEAWDTITREYNASPHTTVEVSSKQLRRLLANLKQRQRDAITKKRQYRVATGGESSLSDAKLNPEVAEVASALHVSVHEATDSDILPESIVETIEMPSAASTPNLLFTPSTSVPQPSPSIEPARFARLLSPPPAPPPPPSSSTYLKQKYTILEKEYKDRKRRAAELHALEVTLMEHKIREAKARADLAEYELEQKRSANVPVRNEESINEESMKSFWNEESMIKVEENIK